MKTPSLLGLALALSLLLPRPAEACDPNCATVERVLGTVIVGAPTVLLSGLVAPAIGKGLASEGGRENVPSYGSGVGSSLIGATVGLGVALAVHVGMFPDSKFGNTGSDMSLPMAVAYWGTPPMVGAAVGSYLTYRERGAPQEPSVSVLLAPGPRGLSLSVGGRF